MSFMDIDGSLYSVDTSEPEHSLRLSVELHYFLQRDLDQRTKKKNKSTADLKDKVVGQPSGTKEAKHGDAAAHDTAADVPAKYYVTYTVGTLYEGRSDFLHPSNSFWSNTHEVDVSLEFIADLYEGPIEFKIWKVQKVWGEDPNEPKNRFDAALSRQTLLFRRASLNAIAKRLVMLSKTERLSPKTKRKIETFRNYVLNNYQQLPLTVKVKAPTIPPPRAAPTVKIPVAPHLSGASNARRDALLQSKTNSPASSRGSSASQRSGPAATDMKVPSLTTPNTAVQFEPPLPSPTRHPPPPRNGNAQHEDLSAICTFVRAKTPPHPHHFDEPHRTVHFLPDLPRRQRTLIDQHTHVGSIFVDPSFFFLGEIHATGRLETKVEGLQDAEVGVSLSGPLLTHRQQESLNPMVITVQTIENLPDQPLSYDTLRKKCHPVYTRFAFADQPATRHKSRAAVPQQKLIRLDSRHVLLTGLHDDDELREFFLHNRLEVELHDRDKKGALGQDKQETLAPIQSYGVARFSLAELVAGATYLSMKAPVVPAGAETSLGIKHAVAPGFYLECDTMIKIKVESHMPVFSLNESANAMTRAVLVLRGPMSLKIVSELIEFVEAYNQKALGLDSREHLYEYQLSKEQRRDVSLDVVTGFVVSDKDVCLVFLEGRVLGGMDDLDDFLAGLKDPDICVYMDLNLTFTTRVWTQLCPNLAWIHLKDTIDALMKNPKTFIRSHTPRTAFAALRNCSDIASRNLTTIFELSAHGLLPTLEQLQDLAQTFSAHTDLDRIPLTHLAAVHCIHPLPPPLAPPAAKRTYGIDTNLSPTIRTWLKSRRTKHHTVIADYVSQFPARALPCPREPLDFSPGRTYLYSGQALNTRQALRRHILCAACASGRPIRYPDRRPNRAISLDSVVAPPWAASAGTARPPGWDPRGIPHRGTRHECVQCGEPFYDPTPYDVLPLPLPELRDGEGKLAFHVSPVDEKAVDPRAVFVSHDASKDLEVRRRKNVVLQRIEWDIKCGGTGNLATVPGAMGVGDGVGRAGGSARTDTSRSTTSAVAVGTCGPSAMN
ncbi:hypothetical protein GGF31_007721 [Allomyces arbusculus]|nr:hypothetical protein GGF31_007721 [Allomyces arbusculus]